MIELDSLKKKAGSGAIADINSQFTNSDMTSHTPPFRMSPSDRDASSRASLFSGGSQPHQISKQNTYDNSDGMRSSDGFKSELRNSRRLIQKQGSGMDYSAAKPTGTGLTGIAPIDKNLSDRKMPVGSLRRSHQNSNTNISKFSLPEVTGAQKTTNVLPPISGAGMISSYEPSAMSSIMPGGRKVGRSHRDIPGTESMTKPPLYRKQFETQRDGAKFSDEPMGGRYGTISYTQTDFNPKFEMNSSTGMSSNKNTIKTTVLPAATFEMSTTNYDSSQKPRKRDIMDK